MIKTDVVFITLIYRNYFDLNDLVKSLNNNVKIGFNVVVVDSFYDYQTSKKIKETADLLGCYYISVKNGGYGYGNNQGIKFVKEHFDYSYICICNTDTILETEINISSFKDEICIAPKIITCNGKYQNPYWPYKNNISEEMMYRGYVLNNNFLLYCGIAFNKLFRLFYYINHINKKKEMYIYACHGSFFFLKKDFIDKNSLIFDENMFLFYEEACLANLFEKEDVKIFFNKDIIVRHKEDGSMNIAKIKEYPLLKKSYLYYYERVKNK